MSQITISNYDVKRLPRVGCFGSSSKHKGINQFLMEIKQDFNLNATIKTHYGSLSCQQFINNCNNIANAINNAINIDNNYDLDLATLMKYTTITCSMYQNSNKHIAIQKGLDVISKAVQESVAYMIYSGDFENDKYVLKALVDKLNIFTDPFAQTIVARAILTGMFGNDKDVLKALVNKLDIFTDLEAQQRVAMAIEDRNFGNDKYVLKALVDKLDIFTDLEAQQSVARAIEDRNFGNDKYVLKALVDKLNIFTDEESQKSVAKAILDRSFGNDKDVLKALVNKLDIFTDLEAQQSVARAIKYGKFGDDKDVLFQLIKAPLTHRYIDIIMDQLIKSVNEWQDNEKVQFFSEFKLSNENLSKFNESFPTLPVDSFHLFGKDYQADTICQDFDFIEPFIHVNTPLGEELNRPYDKTGCIVKKTEDVTFTDYKSLKIGGQITINEETYTVLKPFTEDSECIKLQNPQTPNKKLTISTQNNTMYMFKETVVSDYDDNGTETILAPPTVTKKITTQYNIIVDDNASITMKNIDTNGTIINTNNLIEVKKFNDLTIGQYQLLNRPAKYRVQKYTHEDKTYLITLDTTKIDPAFFDGWISTPNFVLYTSLVDNVTVYELDNNNNYPDMIDSQNLVPIKDTLPRWLQIAIDDVTFNLAEYQDREILNFVVNDLMNKLEELVNEDDKKLVSLMKSIIERCIASQGGMVKIASSNSKDQEIKDAINRMCSSATEIEDFSAIVINFIEKDLKKDPIKIAKLGFLLGQLAKQGVLGYAYDSVNNQANNLLYCLSKTCFDELNKISNHNVMVPDNFITELDNGVCIEQLTHNLMNHNTHLDIESVWKKNANI